MDGYRFASSSSLPSHPTYSTSIQLAQVEEAILALPSEDNDTAAQLLLLREGLVELLTVAEEGALRAAKTRLLRMLGESVPPLEESGKERGEEKCDETSGRIEVREREQAQEREAWQVGDSCRVPYVHQWGHVEVSEKGERGKNEKRHVPLHTFAFASGTLTIGIQTSTSPPRDQHHNAVIHRIQGDHCWYSCVSRSTSTSRPTLSSDRKSDQLAYLHLYFSDILPSTSPLRYTA